MIYNGGEQMRYLLVTEIAKKWDVSERSVRNYCAQGRVNGVFLTGKTWNIPENEQKPERFNKKKEQPITLLDILQEQKASKYSGGMDTALPEEVADKMKALLTEYNGKEEKTFEDILDFHVKFERIHPFQDGNGRVGRLIMFKECLKYNIIPFIIEDNLKMFYYRGLEEWNNEKGYLTDTCLTAQDKYKAYLDYFRIAY